MSNKNINQLIKQKLDNFEADVPIDAWTAIEQSLSAQNGARRFIIWRRIAVAAVFLLSIGISGLWLLKDNHPKQLTTITAKKIIPQKSSTHANVAQPLVETDTDEPETTTSHKKTSYKITVPVHTNTENQIYTTDTVAPVVVEKNEIAQIKEQPKPSQKEIENFIRSGDNSNNESNLKSTDDVHKNTFTLLAAVPGGSQSKIVNEFHSLRSASQIDDALKMLNAAESSDVTVSSTRHHSLPLSAGFLLNKKVYKGFSLETGLRYTYMRSDQLQSGSPNYKNEIQELHYLGIPLSLVYRYVELRRFSFYVKAGGMIEKNIAGRWREEIKNSNNESIYLVIQHDLEDKLQWSMHFGAGADYRINHWLNFYLEPSLSYFPNNNSQIDNIRKQQKIDLSFQGGLRVVFN